MGKILRVDLTRQKLTVESLPEEVLRKWIGGRGLGVYLVFKEVNPQVDPFSPENKAVVATGPLTGIAGIPSSGRWCSVTKAPLTNTIHDSHSGGKFGPELKFAGFDAIIIEGASDKPVYLWIHDGKAEIKDATHLWGKDVYDATDRIQEELAPEVGKSEAEKIKVALIGPAGERLVKIANIMNDKSRAAGRGGHGAVWGSKKLKAIAARGHMKPPIANEERFRKIVAKSMELIKKSPITSEALPKYGTAVLVNVINAHGAYPTRNFQTGVMPTADKTSGETMAKEIVDWKKQKEEICWGCPIACARYSKIEKPPFTGEGGGPEYETVWAFGAQTGTDDLAAISKANYLCNELGLDTISMGHIIGTFFELVEKGKIPPEKLRGLKATWGSGEALVELTWRTAYRSGIGDDLAEGAERLARKYGAPELAMVVRGQELPAYDPRGVQGHGLAYATSNRGGCHLRAYLIAPEILGVPQLLDRFETKGKAGWVKHFQDVFATLDSLVVCKFVTFAYWSDVMAEQLSAVTGWDISKNEFEKIGERIWNAERAFNVLAFGDGEKYDTLPKRLLEEPMPEGPSKGHVTRLGEMLPDYYSVRGWVRGRPTRAKLEELDLKWIADKLAESGLL
ncbi:MAG: aldehyde ferredoxin oxidoreductase family protein [Sulfolobales archaeon]|nr:aldehyde ferredoxin oxidoreductase family protein [Sulfolobales archaeon]MDW8082726.1 aldehyde ferredoxin oxidoreductase family protein [Sulfolobales archaeon]